MKKRCLAFLMAVLLMASQLLSVMAEDQAMEATIASDTTESETSQTPETEPIQAEVPETKAPEIQEPETKETQIQETQIQEPEQETSHTEETSSNTDAAESETETSAETETTSEEMQTENEIKTYQNTKTEDWLEQLKFSSKSMGGSGIEYPIQPEFSPEIHEYTLKFPDYLKGIYGLATSLLNENVMSSYVDCNGELQKDKLNAYAKYGNYAAMNYIVDYGPDGNTMEITSLSGEKEYLVHVERILSLGELKARYKDTDYVLYNHEREELFAEAVLNFQKNYDLYLPGNTQGETLSIWSSTFFYKYADERKIYKVQINGTEVPSDQYYDYTLKGGEESIEIRLSYEGCEDTVYTLNVHPVEKQISMTFSTDTEDAADTMFVKMYDKYGAELKSDQENPLTFRGLLENNEYSYVAYALGYQPVKGKFTAREEKENTVITFSEQTSGRYLEKLQVTRKSYAVAGWEQALERHEELDEQFGAVVYTAEYDDLSNSNYCFYVSAKLSAFAPEDSEVTISTTDLNGNKIEKNILISNDDTTFMNGFGKLDFFGSGQNGAKRGIVTVTVGNDTDREIYKIIVYRQLQLKSLTCSDTPGGDDLYNEKKFVRTRHEYNVAVSDQVENLYLTPTEYPDAGYRMLVNGSEYQSGDTVTVPLQDGSQDITVTLEKEESYQEPEFAGETYTSQGTYIIHVVRAQVSDVTFKTDPEDAIVCVYDTTGKRICSTEEQPHVFTGLTGSAEYSYDVTCYGFRSQSGTFQAEQGQKIEIQLERADTRHEEIQDNEWWNYRNNEENNGITGAATPNNPDEISEKWSVKLGGSWSESCTPPLILGGAIYTGAGKYIYKLDKETGEILAVSDQLKGSLVFALNPLTYAEGMIFAQVGNGQIQALDATTLKSVWISEALGGQTLSPVTYKDGYLYTGTWNSESKEGYYFCLSVTDEDPTSGTEIKKCTWKYSHKGGYYWAGSYATSDYVVFGSDDGSAEGDYTNSSILYSVSAKTGLLIDSKVQLKGDIRTSVVYANGFIYFATKGGMLYRVKMNANGTFGQTDAYYLGGMATASPVVYKGRIYIGVCGTGGQFSTDSGHHFDVLRETANGISLAYSVPMKGYPQAGATLSNAYENEDFNGDGQPDGRVYLYFTYNTYPGGISVLSDEPGQTTGKVSDLFVPEEKKQEYCISTICVDKEGTLYYKNDSGYLMAVMSNSAYITDMDVTCTNGKVRWDDDFQPSKGSYTLTLPSGAQAVKIKLTLPEGRTATVNGATYTGECEILLNEKGEGKAEITVQYQKQKRTYYLKLLGLGSDAELSGLIVSDNNSVNATESYLELNPSFQADKTEYATAVYSGGKKFLNIYAATSGSYATVIAETGEGVRRIMTFKGAAGANGMTRFAVYFDEQYAEADVTLRVTAGDGVTTKDYQITLVRTDNYPPVLSNEKIWRTGEASAQLSFHANEKGKIYWMAVEQGAGQPEFDLTQPGLVMQKGENQILLDQLGSAAKDIYFLAVDEMGNVMDQPHKLSLSEYSEIDVSFTVSPVQSKICVTDDSGKEIPVKDGICRVYLGNRYRVTVSYEGYSTEEMEFTASAETLHYEIILKSNRSAEASLKGLYVSSSDKYGKGILKLTPDFEENLFHYNASYDQERSYLNLWMEPKDKKATVQVFALSGIKGDTVSREDESLEVKNVDGHLCCAIYFEKQLFEAGVRVCVTAEDGTMKNYYVTLSIRDTTAPVIKPVTAARITEKKASVVFKSSEKGYFYYLVTEKDESSDIHIDISGKGIKGIAGTNTISLNGLTKGEKRIHIVMKDEAGNFSEILVITIPDSRLIPGSHAGGPQGHKSSMYVRKKNGSVEEGSGKLRRMNRRGTDEKTDSLQQMTSDDIRGQQEKESNMLQKDTNDAGKEMRRQEDGKEGSGSGTDQKKKTGKKLPLWMQITMIGALFGILYLGFWVRAYRYDRRRKQVI